MNEQLQRIAIAEHLGWIEIKAFAPPMIPEGMPPGLSHWQSLSTLPNFTNDLNAMREAEATLTKEQCHEFNEQLLDTRPNPKNAESYSARWTWHATAPQRAEAFLKTLGLWATPPTEGPEA